MKKLFALFILLSTIFGAQANEYLRPDEVRALLVGKKVLGRASNGSLLDFQMNEDFSSSTSAAGGDVGKWRLNEDGYCISWVKIRKGTEMCFKVKKNILGAHFVVYPDGTLVQLVRID